MRYVAGVVVMLAVGWGLVGCADDGAADVPDGVTGAVEAFNAAINSYDSEALLDATTEDFTWESTGAVQSRSEFVAYFDEHYEVGGFRFESTGELVVERDDDGFIAEEPGRVTSVGYDAEGRSVFRVVESGDAWLVQQFRWYETGPGE